MNETLPDQTLTGADLQTKLATETARIRWHDLQRFYAKGQVVKVAPALNLVAVAAALAEDDRQQFEQWLAADQVAAPSAEQARQWFDADAILWAVVVAPWVLVQETGE